MNPTNNRLLGCRAASQNRLPLSVYALAVISCLALSAVCLQAQSEPPIAQEGEKMERQMWADFKAKDWKAVESKIAEGFQSVHPDGARDRAGEISLIEHLNLGEFTLSNFKTTVNGDTIVVTYTIAVHAAIAHKRLTTKATTPLNCWN